MTDRATFRHRNTKNSWAAEDLIHTFWVGQRVVRSWERKSFMDQIGEMGTVSALPTPERDTLLVLVDRGPAAEWSPTESIPLRKHLDGNRRRLRAVAQDYAKRLKQLDENGVEL